MLAPRFKRLNRSWVKDVYMNILMKYPSILMVLQVGVGVGVSCKRPYFQTV